MKQVANKLSSGTAECARPKVGRVARGFLAFILAFVMCAGLLCTVPQNAQAAQTWLADGVYEVTVNLYQEAQHSQYSMGSAALRGSVSYDSRNASDTGCKSLLIVEDGKAELIVEFMPMGYLGTFGYLWKLDNVTSYQSYTNYVTESAQVLSEHRMTDGTIAYDSFNATNSSLPAVAGQVYPRTMALEYDLPDTDSKDTAKSSDEGTLVHVFVPVMEAMNTGSGDQLALLRLDYDSLEAMTEDEVSKNVYYQLYEAMNLDGKEGGTAYTQLQTLVTQTKSTLSNVTVSVTNTSESGNIITRVANEPTDTQKEDMAANLATAIKAAEEEANPYDPENPYGATAWDGTTQTVPKQDAETGYYLISNGAELAWFAQQVNDGNNTINAELTNNINLGKKEWTTIGKSTAPGGGYSPYYSGTFNGNGYTVYNLSSTSGYPSGLFGVLYGVSADQPAVVENLNVEGTITCGSYAGGIAASAYKWATISNCNANVDITCTIENTSKYGNYSYAGGIAGYTGSVVTIENCVNEGDVNSTTRYGGSGSSQQIGRVGGITGFMSNSSKIIGCANKGNITGGNYTAGLVGYISVGYSNKGVAGVYNSYNEGNVTGQISPSALVFGVNTAGATADDDPTWVEIKNVYNTGKVTGTAGYNTNIISTSNSRVTADSIYSVGESANEYSTNYRLGFAYARGTSANSSTLSNAYVLEGTTAKLTATNFETYVTSTNVAEKTSDYLKSDAFFEDGGFEAFARGGDDVNSGYPIIAERSDYTAVDTAIANVPEDTSIYTEESVQVLEDALGDVVKYLSKDNQEEVNAMATSINAAVEALVEKDADYTAVDAAIAKVPANMNAYTDDSAADVKTAVEAVDRTKKITEQDSVDSMAQAIEDAIANLELTPVGEFVTRLYEVLLDRGADAEGLAAHVANLTGKVTGGAQTAYEFVFSEEFKNRNMCDEHFVEYMYSAFFDREADDVGKQGWLNELANGKTREEVFNGFALSTEFKDLCEDYGIEQGSGIEIPQYGTMPAGPCTIDNCGKTDGVIDFVYRMYDVCLDRVPENGEQNGWVNALRTHANTGTQCADGFFESTEYEDKDTGNRQYVKDLYAAYFGRTPENSEVNDWVAALKKEGRTQVRNGFSNSTEFANLCEEYGIIA